MCEFNRPYPVPFGKHPDDVYGRRNETLVHPPEAWARREAELPQDEIAVIEQAVQEAASTGADVHLYRKVGSRFLGLAFESGDGPRVKIWEH